MLHSRFSLVICFIHSCVYVSIPISQFTPPPLPPLVSISLRSTSVSLFLLCKQVHLCHFCRFHVWAISYGIRPSLWLTPLCGTGSRSTRGSANGTTLFPFTAEFKIQKVHVFVVFLWFVNRLVEGKKKLS